MDIDAFLEDEKDKMEKSSGPKVVIKQDKLSIKSNSIPDQIDKLKVLLSKNQFKEAGDLYMQVKERFSNLTKVQIEEKNFIHKSLSNINEELTAQLSNLMAETDKKTQMIENLLGKSENYLNEGKLEVADELYKQIKQFFQQLPDVFSEKKLRLENKILNFFSRLSIENSKKIITDFERKKSEINSLLDQAFKEVEQTRLDLARKRYIKINQLYGTLPEGFIYEKLMMYKRILRLYNEAELSLEIKELSSELADIEKQIEGSPMSISSSGAAPIPKSVQASGMLPTPSTPKLGSAGVSSGVSSGIPKPGSVSSVQTPSQVPSPGKESKVSDLPKPNAPEAPHVQEVPKANNVSNVNSDKFNKPAYITKNEITKEHLENPPPMIEVPSQKSGMDVPPEPKKKGIFGFGKK